MWFGAGRAVEEDVRLAVAPLGVLDAIVGAGRLEAGPDHGAGGHANIGAELMGRPGRENEMDL